MSAGHTPGPWHVGEGAQTRIIYAEDGFAVADATVFHARHEASADDNAAFIVRTCNRDHLFDEMVAALRDLLAVANVRIDDPRIKQFDAARAILAKVPS